jgi:hypothetical protein
MLPPLIVQEALDRGIHWIAITDHNASGNVAAVQKAAAGSRLTVMPGMEVQTREEVHVLCLFDTLEQLTIFQTVVDSFLPDLKNKADFFGEQFVVDEQGEFVCREERLLLTSVNLSFEKVFQEVQQHQGLMIPAHVDRKAFGLLANLGLVPADVPVEGLEISRHLPASQAAQQFPQIKGYPLMQGGDAHRLNEMLGVNEFHVAAPTVAEISLALAAKDSRSLVILPPTNG